MRRADGADDRGWVRTSAGPRSAVKAAYGYRPYGNADPDLTKGDLDLGNPAAGKDPLAALSPYRYTGKRHDPASKSLDMGARRFGPDPGRFLQRDRYRGALSNLRLSVDPLTQNRYALASGNPVSFVEVDRHHAAPSVLLQLDPGVAAGAVPAAAEGLGLRRLIRNTARGARVVPEVPDRARN